MPELNEMVEVLRNKVAETKFVDVGEEAARAVGVSIVKLRTALATLRNEGYGVYKVSAKQAGTDVVMILRVLTLPGTSFKDAHEAFKQGHISSL